MASLKLLLGFIPDTAKIEQDEKALVEEYEKLQSFSSSGELAKYNELNSVVNSGDFQSNKKKIESLSYNGSEEQVREKEFLSLHKSKDISMYFKTLEGDALRKFNELDGSDRLKRYDELEKMTKSSAFIMKQKSKDKEHPFKQSEEYAMLQEYLILKKSQDIKEYFKFKSSKFYANYLKVSGSARLARYNELLEYTNSDGFKEKKAYLLDKKRFEKSDDFKRLQEFEILAKNNDIVWYLKVKDSNKFDHIKTRKLLFSDEFDAPKLDTGKWLTNTYWGDKLLKDRYAVESDLQLYTERDNLVVQGGELSIVTKPQKVKGKVWSAAHGFSTKDFEFTSGIVNTANSFRQKYGTFSAKIKLGNPDARNAFWLLSDAMAPHLDICRTSKGKVWFDLISSVKKISKTSLPGKYAGKFYIYTLVWTAKSLVWYINGMEVFRQTSDVPQEEMYINLAGGLDKPISAMTTMEIDWVRVYE